ncbi:MAG: radical SAM protein [Candidatus Aureabacteria bacterium]|nr:radical SAM protein [Candidatus Auribacterota bacterium]
MNKILFLNPPLSTQERYGALAAAGAMEPPHGLTYLASVMRESGWDTHILDAEALRLNESEAVERTISLSPEIVACTAVTLSIQRAAAVAAAVKKLRPDIITIAGGVHLTSQPNETMLRFPSFDYGVIGEGERTLAELAAALSDNQETRGIPGVVSRDGARVHQAPRRPFIKELDTLPMPAWDLLPHLPRYYYLPPQSIQATPSTSLITSRGCTGRCIFCDTSVFRNVCRAHSAEYVVEMIRTLRHRFGIREILFEDDNFMIFGRRLQQLTELMTREGITLSWSCLARADMMPDPSVLQDMRRAGCWQILIGIESGCQEILDFEKKGITLEQIEDAVRRVRSAGMRTKGFLMLGHPMETEETIKRTLRFVTRIPLDDISVTFFTVFPGAPIAEEASRYGRVISDFSKMSVFQPTFIPEGFTAEKLDLYARYYLKKFYLRPRIVLSYLGRMRSWRQLRAMLKGACALLGHLFRRHA